MYELNSFDRYKEGKRLSDKYTKPFVQCCILMVIVGFGGFLALEVNKISGLWSIPAMLIPTYFGLKYSLIVTRGELMMKSAKSTFGSDEEEYL